MIGTCDTPGCPEGNREEEEQEPEDDRSLSHGPTTDEDSVIDGGGQGPFACIFAWTGTFFFQLFNLIASMTAEENVALPLIFKGISPRKRIKMARRALKEMGLETRAKHRPSEMSGGQMQRVGIARALVVDPKIIFADEPTGNLDSRTSQEILRLIRRISREKGQTVVMVTHDRHLAEVADRIFDIRDGKILNIDKGKYSHLSDEELSILALADEGEDHETA